MKVYDRPVRIVVDRQEGWIEAQLTDEGVIVDRYDDDENIIATYAQTYEEILMEGERS